MRVMVLVKATEDSEKGLLPTAETIEAMGRFNEELARCRHPAPRRRPQALLAGQAGCLRRSHRMVIDGPFAETHELVAGFWLWEVKDMDEAVAWVKRCPNPMPGPSEIEIRPLFELADLIRETDAGDGDRLSDRSGDVIEGRYDEASSHFLWHQ